MYYQQAFLFVFIFCLVDFYSNKSFLQSVTGNTAVLAYNSLCILDYNDVAVTHTRDRKRFLLPFVLNNHVGEIHSSHPTTNSSAIRQKGEPQNGCYKKTKHAVDTFYAVKESA